MRSVRTLIGVALLSGALCGAQAPSVASQGPDGNSRSFVPGIEVLPYAGAPFSATESMVRVRTLPGGGTVTSELTARIVRDAEGRLYRERHHFGPPELGAEKTLYEFYIEDPIARVRTECVVATHHCETRSYFPRTTYAERPAGPYDNGRMTLARERLGEQTINDLQVTGTRETTTLAPGVVGNDQMLTLTRELWFSPELKTNLQVVRSDPRDGTVTIKLKDLTRAAPDPSAFAVPSGYTVESAPAAVHPSSSR